MHKIKQPWEYEKAMDTLLKEVVDGFRKDNPVLGGIRTMRTRHGGSARIDTETGAVILPPRVAEATYLLKNEAMEHMDLVAYEEMLAEMAHQLAEAGAKMLFETVGTVAEAAHMTVDGKGKSLDHDMILDMIEKFPAELFNEKGELGEGFAFYVNPSMAQKIADMVETPAQKRRAEEIKKKKLEEKMLRNVLGVYLNDLKDEADLRGILLHLLPEMGHDNVALLHGPREHGKDLISHFGPRKLRRQWCVQAKIGNMKKKHATDILKQLDEAAMTDAPHPYFESSLPRTVLVVTNGTVNNDAAAVLAGYENGTLKAKGYRLEIWDHEKLLDNLEKHLSKHLLIKSLSDTKSLGRLLGTIALCTQGQVNLHELEEVSRSWLDTPNLFRPVLEAAVLDEALMQSESLYESFYVHLCLSRTLGANMEADPSGAETISGSVEEMGTRLQNSAAMLMSQAEKAVTEGKQLSSYLGTNSVITASVMCHRWLEACTMFYQLAGSDEERNNASSLSEKILQTFPQATKPISDKYAVTVFGVAGILLTTGKREEALNYTRTVANWVLDRYETPGSGLAGVDDPVEDDVRHLLGQSFSGVPERSRMSSLLLTALMDIAIVAKDSELYADLVNDSIAVTALPEAYSVPESIERWSLDAPGVIHIPNLYPSETPLPALLQHWGAGKEVNIQFWIFWATALALRDRWFPERLNMHLKTPLLTEAEETSTSSDKK